MEGKNSVFLLEFIPVLSFNKIFMLSEKFEFELIKSITLAYRLVYRSIY